MGMERIILFVFMVLVPPLAVFNLVTVKRLFLAFGSVQLVEIDSIRKNDGANCRKLS